MKEHNKTKNLAFKVKQEVYDKFIEVVKEIDKPSEVLRKLVEDFIKQHEVVK